MRARVRGEGHPISVLLHALQAGVRSRVTVRVGVRVRVGVGVRGRGRVRVGVSRPPACASRARGPTDYY